MTDTPCAYVDTNILISYALGDKKDERFQIAKKIFEECLQGKYILVLSHFVYSEALHALRNISTKEVFREIKNRRNQKDIIKMANSSEFRKKVNDRSLESFRIIIDKITNDPDHFRVEKPETSYSGKMFLEGLKILSRNFGEFRVYRYRCPKCDSYLNCEKCGFYCEIAYKSINAPDVTHVLISTALGCTYFFTMDQYFSRIPKEEFQTEIVVLR